MLTGRERCIINFISKCGTTGEFGNRENNGNKERVRLCAREEIILNSLIPQKRKNRTVFIAAQRRPGTSGHAAARARELLALEERMKSSHLAGKMALRLFAMLAGLLLTQTLAAGAQETYTSKQMFSINVSTNPHAYYIDDNENAYSFDIGAGTIEAYDKTGKQILKIPTDIKPMANENVDVTANEIGEVLVYTENLLKIYDRKGNLIKAVTQKMYPQRLAFSGKTIYSIDSGKVVYVLDGDTKAIKQKKFVRDFSYKRKTTEKGIVIESKKDKKQINLPGAVAGEKSQNYKFDRVNDVDDVGHIYAFYKPQTGNSGDMLVKFDDKGNQVAKFDGWPLKINKQTETVYSAKREDGRLTFYKQEKKP